MTNREMVKRLKLPPAGKDTGAKPLVPEPNLPPPHLQPATESDAAIYTPEEPLDSPGPKPMINPRKTNGLKRDR